MENENTNTIPTEPKDNGVGGIIGVIIIVIIIIAGGWYFIGNRVEKIQNNPNTEVPDITTGTSTELIDIQTDLDNLDIDILNQE